MMPRPLLAIPALLLVLCAAALAATAPADAAGTYTVWSCRDADGDPLPATAWRPGGTAGTRSDTCMAPGGGSLAVTLSSATAAQGASAFRFDVPAGVQLQSYEVWMAARTASFPLNPQEFRAGIGQYPEFGVPTIDVGCPLAVASCTAGTFTDLLDDANHRGPTAVTEPVLALAALCPPGDQACVPDIGADAGARAELYRSKVTVLDPTTPTVGPIGGTVGDGPVISGTRSVHADVTDAGSGVRLVELLVDGDVVDAYGPGGGCTPPYTVADPCPRTLRASFVLNTAALTVGEHAITLRVTDAADNAATSSPLDVWVVRSGGFGGVVYVPVPSAPAPAPAASPAPPPPARPTDSRDEEPPPATRVTLSAPKTVELPASRRATGTVRAANGAPKGGVRLSFQQRPLGGGEDDWRPFGPDVTTNAAGRFDLPVVRRTLEVRVRLAGEAFVASPAIVRFVEDLDATIDAPAPRLRNGDRLTLRGRFRNAGGALDERPVLIQAVVRGRWTTVDSVEADGDGRVVWRYRFEHTRTTARYRFRFVLPKQRGLPWTRTVTDVVTVLVDGHAR